jgi:hypothetical protein
MTEEMIDTGQNGRDTKEKGNLRGNGRRGKSLEEEAMIESLRSMADEGMTTGGVMREIKSMIAGGTIRHRDTVPVCIHRY